MKATGWERIYRERGDLNYRVLPKIVRAAEVFKERGYKKILDLGCGTGRHAIYLAKKGFAVYATDMAETGLKIAREKAAALGLKDIRFKQHDMRTLPFADGSFDAVICTWALHHGTVVQIRQTIGEMHRVLKWGGMVVTDLLAMHSYAFNLGREVEKNTFIGAKEMEEDVLHHYTTREEIGGLFSAFSQLTARLATKYYPDRDTGKRYVSKRYNIIAVK